MEQAKNFSERDVRKAIVANAYTTTLKELEKKGRNKIKVIKGRRIYEMIAQAVDQVVKSSSMDSEQKRLVVEESRQEFDRLVQAHHSEARRLRETEAELIRTQAKSEFLRSENQKLETEIGALRGQVAPNQDNADRDLLEKLVSDVSSLSESLIAMRGASPAVASSDGGQLESASAGLREKFSSMLEVTMGQLSDRFNSKLDQMEDEKAYKAVEAAEVALDGLFAVPEAIESNLNNVEIREASESGINDQLSRLRNVMGQGEHTQASGDKTLFDEK